MNPTFTLETIRSHSPCSTGWKSLLTSLGYADANYDPNRLVSLGDIAKSNGAADAYWCLRCLDMDDITNRRLVIGSIVLPTVKRVAIYTTDSRVHDCIAAIESWVAGDDTVDLKAAADAAYAARAAERENQRQDIMTAFPPIN